ncbi:hypothetical protein K438DRAFT_1979585 [Mycena galopus ATCC 62051]|nr:hypothetical protein K438DRAFT_1979585 [Mycena galopus ATCC 62051]
MASIGVYRRLSGPPWGRPRAGRLRRSLVAHFGWRIYRQYHSRKHSRQRSSASSAFYRARAQTPPPDALDNYLARASASAAFIQKHSHQILRDIHAPRHDMPFIARATSIQALPQQIRCTISAPRHPHASLREIQAPPAHGHPRIPPTRQDSARPPALRHPPPPASPPRAAVSGCTRSERTPPGLCGPAPLRVRHPRHHTHPLARAPQEKIRRRHMLSLPFPFSLLLPVPASTGPQKTKDRAHKKRERTKLHQPRVPVVHRILARADGAFERAAGGGDASELAGWVRRGGGRKKRRGEGNRCVRHFTSPHPVPLIQHAPPLQGHCVRVTHTERDYASLARQALPAFAHRASTPSTRFDSSSQPQRPNREYFFLPLLAISGHAHSAASSSPCHLAEHTSIVHVPITDPHPSSAQTSTSAHPHAHSHPIPCSEDTTPTRPPQFPPTQPLHTQSHSQSPPQKNPANPNPNPKTTQKNTKHNAPRPLPLPIQRLPYAAELGVEEARAPRAAFERGRFL